MRLDARPVATEKGALKNAARNNHQQDSLGKVGHCMACKEERVKGKSKKAASYCMPAFPIYSFTAPKARLDRPHRGRLYVFKGFLQSRHNRPHRLSRAGSYANQDFPARGHNAALCKHTVRGTRSHPSRRRTLTRIHPRTYPGRYRSWATAESFLPGRRLADGHL